MSLRTASPGPPPERGRDNDLRYSLFVRKTCGLARASAVRAERFSLASLLALVLFAALGLAGLRSASDLWASVVFTLTLGLLGFAAMVMLYMIFSKLFPIIAVWEFKPHIAEEE